MEFTAWKLAGVRSYEQCEKMFRVTKLAIQSLGTFTLRVGSLARLEDRTFSYILNWYLITPVTFTGLPCIKVGANSVSLAAETQALCSNG